MPRENLIMLGMGGLFILLGLLSLTVGRREKNDFYKAVANRSDWKEFVERSPLEPIALKIGGWLAITVGLILALLGGILWFWR